MLEKTITNKILKYLKSRPECFCFKMHGGMYSVAGIPDIICCYKGLFIAFEVKTTTGKLTNYRKSPLKKLRIQVAWLLKSQALRKFKKY